MGGGALIDGGTIGRLGNAPTGKPRKDSIVSIGEPMGLLAIVIPICALLGGCSAPAKVAWTPPEIANQEDDAKCQGYGAARGSDAYVSCRATLDAQRSQMKDAYAGRIAAGLSGAGASIQQTASNVASVQQMPPPQTWQASPAPQTQTRCVTSPSLIPGGDIVTRCN